MRRSNDLLVELSLEHRELTQAAEELRQQSEQVSAEAVRDAAVRIVEHELAHRLLVHPLLRRDRRGRQLFGERREEQLLLADRLRHALTAVRAVPRGEAPPDRGVDAVSGLDQQLVAHTDREEIIAFPHLRRIVDREELTELGEVRRHIREVVSQRLMAEDSPVVDGSWASVARRDLPALLDLPEDLVIEIPDLEVPQHPANSL